MKRLLLLAAMLLLICPILSAQATKPVTLDWADNPPNQQIQFYNVYQSSDNVSYTKLPENYTDSEAILELVPGIYYFKVTATNVWGETEFSNMAQTPRIGTPPQQITITISITVP